MCACVCACERENVCVCGLIRENDREGSTVINATQQREIVCEKKRKQSEREEKSMKNETERPGERQTGRQRESQVERQTNQTYIGKAA